MSLDAKNSKEVFSTSTDPEVGDTYSTEAKYEVGNEQPAENVGRWQAFKDSFKKMEEPEYAEGLTDLEKAAIRTANSPLQKSLKNRHLQMIAIGGSIGTGLFIGSGNALKTGGPASLVIGWILMGAMLFCMCNALGELAVVFPVSGAFNTYATRFIDPSLGFAMGWNYALQWFVVLPLELVAASITVQYWNKTINPDAWVCIFYTVIVAINFFGVKGYGEAEFLFSFIKVIAVIGFIILGIILTCGGGPVKGYIGGKYWHDPGAFAAGFKGVCTVFVTAAFSFAGTELVGLAAAESANPRKFVPRATKQVFWRIALFYIISLTLIGLLVPYTNENLGVGGSYNAAASPFVIAIKTHGIKGLPSVINVVIMIAVLSVGNSSVYGCSRTLASLASQGMAPEIFAYVDRAGRPLWGIVVTSIFGLLSFISASPKEGDVFNWLLALSGLSSIFTWGSICLAHLRVRYAMKVQGRNPFEEFAYTSQCGVIGSAFGLLMNVLVLMAQFWVALFPLGGSPNASDFFQAYLAAPVVLAFYIGHKLWKRNFILYIRGKDIDLDTGRANHDLELLKQEIAEEKAALAAKPFYYRVYRFWC